MSSATIHPSDSAPHIHSSLTTSTVVSSSSNVGNTSNNSKSTNSSSNNRSVSPPKASNLSNRKRQKSFNSSQPRSVASNQDEESNSTVSNSVNTSNGAASDTPEHQNSYSNQVVNSASGSSNSSPLQSSYTSSQVVSNSQQTHTKTGSKKRRSAKDVITNFIDLERDQSPSKPQNSVINDEKLIIGSNDNSNKDQETPSESESVPTTPKIRKPTSTNFTSAIVSILTSPVKKKAKNKQGDESDGEKDENYKIVSPSSNSSFSSKETSSLSSSANSNTSSSVSSNAPYSNPTGNNTTNSSTTSVSVSSSAYSSATSSNSASVVTFAPSVTKKLSKKSLKKKGLVKKEKKPKVCYLQTLPVELLLKTVCNLDVVSLLTMAVTSKMYNQVCKESFVWHVVAVKMMRAGQRKPKILDWKSYAMAIWCFRKSYSLDYGDCLSRVVYAAMNAQNQSIQLKVASSSNVPPSSTSNLSITVAPQLIQINQHYHPDSKEGSKNGTVVEPNTKGNLAAGNLDHHHESDQCNSSHPSHPINSSTHVHMGDYSGYEKSIENGINNPSLPKSSSSDSILHLTPSILSTAEDAKLRRLLILLKQPTFDPLTNLTLNFPSIFDPAAGLDVMIHRKLGAVFKFKATITSSAYKSVFRAIHLPTRETVVLTKLPYIPGMRPSLRPNSIADPLQIQKTGSTPPISSTIISSSSNQNVAGNQHSAPNSPHFSTATADAEATPHSIESSNAIVTSIDSSLVAKETNNGATIGGTFSDGNPSSAIAAGGSSSSIPSSHHINVTHLSSNSNNSTGKDIGNSVCSKEEKLSSAHSGDHHHSKDSHHYIHSDPSTSSSEHMDTPLFSVNEDGYFMTQVRRKQSSFFNTVRFYGDRSYLVGDYGLYFDGSSIWHITECCSGGSCRQQLDNGFSTFSENEIAFITRDILKSLVFLHSKGYIHGNISASCFMISEARQGRAIVKLRDKSVAQAFAESMIGTPAVRGKRIYWSPPENTISTAVDIWSLGIALIELAEGKPPNWNMSPAKARAFILNEPPPSLRYPTKWSLKFRAFLDRCLSKDPNKRFSAPQLMGLAFITEIPNYPSKKALYSPFSSRSRPKLERFNSSPMPKQTLAPKSTSVSTNTASSSANTSSNAPVSSLSSTRSSLAESRSKKMVSSSSGTSLPKSGKGSSVTAEEPGSTSTTTTKRSTRTKKSKQSSASSSAMTSTASTSAATHSAVEVQHSSPPTTRRSNNTTTTGRVSPSSSSAVSTPRTSNTAAARRRKLSRRSSYAGSNSTSDTMTHPYLSDSDDNISFALTHSSSRLSFSWSEDWASGSVDVSFDSQSRGASQF